MLSPDTEKMALKNTKSQFVKKRFSKVIKLFMNNYYDRSL